MKRENHKDSNPVVILIKRWRRESGGLGTETVEQIKNTYSNTSKILRTQKIPLRMKKLFFSFEETLFPKVLLLSTIF